MKRITLLLLAVFAMESINAQDITDGLIYSSEATTGTARFNALSGAFGALGGDLSAIYINPAGGPVFLKSSAAISVAGNDTDNRATYFNTRTNSIDTDINANQAGGILVFNNRSENSKFKKFTIAFNYQVEKNYNNELIIKGTGNNSIGDFFLANAQGISLDLLQLQDGESISDLYIYLGENEGTSAQNAFLGYQGFIIDPVDGDDSQYVSNIAPGSFNHEYAYLTQGTKNKYTVNLGTQVTNNFFFGINLNTHSIYYDRSTFLFEGNSNPGSLVTEVGFENNLAVRGFGLSAQLGVIAKIQESFRLGLSLQSPTWYDMSEETTQFLDTRRLDNGQSIITTVNPRVINVFENYYLRTPGKVTASAAYIFGSNGLISFDYSFKDYGSIRFDSYDSYDYYDSYDNDTYFNDVNNTIEDSLNGVSSFRIGGEYRINQISLRGGFKYEDSPYKNEDVIGDLSGFSFGLGYNLGNYNIDLSYARAEQDRKQQLYSVGLVDTANITTVSSSIAFTLGFTF